jgi:RNA polymerase sigma-70 factor (family 1)
MDLIRDESDKQLILRLKEGDIKAFDLLYHKYSKRLLHFSFSLLKSEEHSKGIVQEAFLRIWKRRAKIDSSKSFKSFLFTISYNLIVDQLRSRLKDEKYREFLIRYFESEKFNLEDELDYKNMIIQIRKAVDEFPSKRKKIYILSREVGLTHKEIATQLEISVKTVENQIGLALKDLRKCLGSNIFQVLLFISLFG